MNAGKGAGRREEGVGQGDMTVRMACDRSLPHSRDSSQHLVIEPSSVLDLERHHNGAFAPRVGMRQRDCDAGNESSEPDGVLHPGAYHAKKTHCERSLCGPTPGPTAARGHRQGHGLAWCTGTGSAATRQGAFDGMCAQAMVAPGGGAFPERQWRRRVAGAWDIGRVTSRHDALPVPLALFLAGPRTRSHAAKDGHWRPSSHPIRPVWRPQSEHRQRPPGPLHPTPEFLFLFCAASLSPTWATPGAAACDHFPRRRAALVVHADTMCPRLLRLAQSPPTSSSLFAEADPLPALPALR